MIQAHAEGINMHPFRWKFGVESWQKRGLKDFNSGLEMPYARS